MPDGESPLFGLGMRQMPMNLRAEQALLGAILANNKAMDRVSGFLRHDHFADPINGRIYEAALHRISNGQIADSVTLRQYFENAGILDEVGGVEYLVALNVAMVGIIQAGDYGRAIHDAWLRRQLIQAAEEGAALGFGADPAVDAEAAVTTTVQRLLALGDSGIRNRGTSFADAMDAAIARAEAVYKGGQDAAAFTSGLPSIDDLWGGIWPEEQTFICARSRTGKTPLMLQVARNVARQMIDRGQGEHVQVFSLENSAANIGTVNLSGMTGVDADSIRNGRLAPDQWNELHRARREYGSLPIIVEDAAGLTLSQILVKARAAARTRKVRLVCIDHRDIIGRDAEMARSDPMRWLPHVTHATKQLAKAINGHVILLTQLNRIEGRDDPRPRLSDIPYGCEQDADTAIFLHRAELYMPDSPPNPPAGTSAEKAAALSAEFYGRQDAARGVAEVMFLKKRFGKPGTARMRFDGPSMLLREIEQQDHDAGLF